MAYAHSEAAQALRNELSRQRLAAHRSCHLRRQAEMQLREQQQLRTQWQLPEERQGDGADSRIAPNHKQQQQQQRQEPHQLHLGPQADALPAAPPWSISCPEEARGIVVGWLVEVVSLLGLAAPTLATAVELMDAFMQAQAAPTPDRLVQLVALACLALAVKQEEGAQHPSTQEWVNMATNPETGAPMYEVDDFRRMEWLVLETLEWRTLLPSPYGFLQRLVHCLAETRGSGDPWVTSAGAGGALARGGRGSHSCVTALQEGGAAAEADGLSEVLDGNALQRVAACANFLTELVLPCGSLQAAAPSTLAVACLELAMEVVCSTVEPVPGPAGMEALAIPCGSSPCSPNTSNSSPNRSRGCPNSSTAGGSSSGSPQQITTNSSRLRAGTALFPSRDDVEMDTFSTPSTVTSLLMSPNGALLLLSTGEVPYTREDTRAPAEATLAATAAATPAAAHLNHTGGFTLVRTAAATAQAYHVAAAAGGASPDWLSVSLNSVELADLTNQHGPDSSSDCGSGGTGAVSGSCVVAPQAGLVPALAAAFGVSEQQLAPGLPECRALLASAHECAMQWYHGYQHRQALGLMPQTLSSGMVGASADTPPPPPAPWLCPAVWARHHDAVAFMTKIAVWRR